jgi:hypothetical protein
VIVSLSELMTSEKVDVIVSEKEPMSLVKELVKEKQENCVFVSKEWVIQSLIHQKAQDLNSFDYFWEKE